MLFITQGHIYFTIYLVTISWQSASKYFLSWLLFKSYLLRVKKQAIPLCHKLNKKGRRTSWMNRELFLELKQYKKVCDISKQGQVTQEDYRATVRKEGKRQKDKAKLKMKLASNVSGLQKGFYFFY